MSSHTLVCHTCLRRLSPITPQIHTLASHGDLQLAVPMSGLRMGNLVTAGLGKNEHTPADGPRSTQRATAEAAAGALQECMGVKPTLLFPGLVHISRVQATPAAVAAAVAAGAAAVASHLGLEGAHTAPPKPPPVQLSQWWQMPRATDAGAAPAFVHNGFWMYVNPWARNIVLVFSPGSATAASEGGGGGGGYLDPGPSTADSAAICSAGPATDGSPGFAGRGGGRGGRGRGRGAAAAVAATTHPVLIRLVIGFEALRGPGAVLMVPVGNPTFNSGGGDRQAKHPPGTKLFQVVFSLKQPPEVYKLHR